MTTSKTHMEKTAAADKAVGFDFQYYYFLYRLLKLDENETVGLEIKDDVHTELSNNKQILVQLKHTVQNNTLGNPTNLTPLDSDLWKTIYNWCKIITDKEDGRADLANQLKFVENTDFLLVSNKSENENNLLLTKIKIFKQNNTNFQDVSDEIHGLFKKATDTKIKNYISEYMSLDNELQEAFIKNISFELDQDDIIQKCKSAIRTKMVPDDKIDEVFSSLDSNIRMDNFISIKNGEKISISFNDFHRKYRRHFDKARNPKLDIKNFNGSLPDNLQDQIFIKQLIDINDIDPNDVESMAEYTRHKLKAYNNLETWEHEGVIVRQEIDALENEAITRWKNKHKKHHSANSNSEDEIKINSIKLINEIRDERLSISSQELPTDISNGEFYNLSDAPKIGWHKKWDDKYK